MWRLISLGLVYAILALPARAAAPSCDQTCAVLQQIIDAGSDGYRALKGSKDSDPESMQNTWSATVVPPGLEGCVIMSADESARASEDTYEYSCFLKNATKANARSTFEALYAALRAIGPGWTWVRFARSLSNGIELPDSVQIFAEPAKGTYIAALWFADYGDVCDLQLRLESRPVKPDFRTAPYRAPTIPLSSSDSPG